MFVIPGRLNPISFHLAQTVRAVLSTPSNKLCETNPSKECANISGENKENNITKPIISFLFDSFLIIIHFFLCPKKFMIIQAFL